MQKCADVLAADAKAQSFRRGPTGREKARLFTLRWKAVSRPSVFTCGTVFGNIELPEQEARDVGIFLDDLVDGATAGVSGLRVVEKRDRTVRAGGGLQPRRELRVRTMARFLWERDERTKRAGACVRDFPLWQFAKRIVSLNNRQKRAPQ